MATTSQLIARAYDVHADELDDDPGDARGTIDSSFFIAYKKGPPFESDVNVLPILFER